MSRPVVGARLFSVRSRGVCVSAMASGPLTPLGAAALPYGIAAGSRRRPASVVASGVALALGVWSASRAEMTAMQIAPPPWQDPPSSLAMDVGFHLVYGLAAAGVFRVLR